MTPALALHNDEPGDAGNRLSELPPLSIWRSSPPIPRALMTVLGLASTVARLHGLSLAQIIAEDRSRPISRARQAAFAACHAAGFSYPQIGHRLKRDHSTVVHGVREHRRRQAERMAAE